MPYYTPLRYPGGKRRLAVLVASLLQENDLRDVQYVEPYAGGAALALSLLLEEYASIVHINDLSRPVFAFWHTVLNSTSELCERVDSVNVTMDEWHRQRAVYERQAAADLDELGFATLFLNRTNRSGIIGGGVIGGKKQTGKWPIDARFNKAELIQRIRKIARYRSRINLHQMDALDFTNQVISGMSRNTFVFYDPPYIEKGDGLYLNEYDVEDHRELSKCIVQLQQPWVVTYDYDGATRHDLYRGCSRFVYNLPYSAQARHGGKEVMFLSPRLKLPSIWRPSAHVPMARPHSEHPLYGMLEPMKSRPDMDEGPQAGERFVKALKTVLSVPKSAVPNPFKKPAKKKKARQLQS